MIRPFYSQTTSLPALVDNAGSPQPLFVATTTGGSGGTNQRMAITTITMCNTGTVDLEDETSDQVIVDLYIKEQGVGLTDANKIVHQLRIPAGETVFFSDEKIVLDGGDSLEIEVDTNGLLAVTVSALEV